MRRYLVVIFVLSVNKYLFRIILATSQSWIAHQVLVASGLRFCSLGHLKLLIGLSIYNLLKRAGQIRILCDERDCHNIH